MTKVLAVLLLCAATAAAFDASSSRRRRKDPTPAPTPSPPGPPAPPGSHNVLLIVVDDLRPNLKSYGHDFMSTPNLDKLASSGVLFQKAYTQYSLCAPARNSFLTGRRPDTTQAFSFMNHFREKGVGDQWSSMPQYFKQHGYNSYGTGKLFHPALPPSFDARYSWDEFTWVEQEGAGGSPKCTDKFNGWKVLEKDITNVKCLKSTETCSNAVAQGAAEANMRWCAVDTEKNPTPLPDQMIAKAAMDYMDKSVKAGKPFFIGVGFHKPHLPMEYPKEFHNVYPESVAAPKQPLPPQGMPLCAWHDQSTANNKWGKPSPAEITNQFRRAYYSAISYTDSLVGDLLDHLDDKGLASSTVVAFLGDHGWQLGEMNLWKKMTNFELGVHIPLIIRAPGMSIAPGTKSQALVEAVDLFPTLVSLAGLTAPQTENLQGTDLTPIFKGATSVKEYAFSQYAKKYVKSEELQHKEAWDVCGDCQREDIDVHGYSVRSDKWRYTEWVKWDKKKLKPKWDDVVGRELYDHTDDDGGDFDKSTPHSNVWNTSDAKKEMSNKLSQVLHNQFDSDHFSMYKQERAEVNIEFV